MTSPAIIKDYVEVAQRFTRSVNISFDIGRNASDYGYIITPTVSVSISQIIGSLLKERGQRSYTLYGPYGSGKSAFAVYISQLLSLNAKIKEESLSLISNNETISKEIADYLKGEDSSFLPVLITARLKPINQLLVEGIDKATTTLNDNEKTNSLRQKIEDNLTNNSWKDSASVMDLIQKLGNEAKNQGYSGLLIIVDEAGKTLEYALRDREGGDVYIYQQIAEYANRADGFTVLFLITLHQQMDSYTDLLSRTTRAEWAKVQERFENIRFAEPASSTIRMIGEAIKHKKDSTTEMVQALRKVTDYLSNNVTILPVGLSKEAFRSYAQTAWPFHPLTLIALPYIFHRFAQNERSIFSFLISEEPQGFQSILNSRGTDEDYGFIRLYDIYDYLLSNFEISLSRNIHAKRLLEANDIINSRSNLSDEEYRLLKTIAMLNVLGDISPIKATKRLLETSLPENLDIDELIDNLTKKSLITYRRLDKSYRVWEGSDVDDKERMIVNR